MSICNKNFNNVVIYLLLLIIITTTAATFENDNIQHYYQHHHHHHDHHHQQHQQQQQQQQPQRLQFIHEPETIWAAPDGRKVSFKCQVLPSMARIRWLLNGTIINDDNNEWIKISENKLSIKLQKSTDSLSNVINLQGAVFQCLAEWNEQVIVSQPAKLIIAELLPFDNDLNDLNITAIAGNNVIIPCNLPHSIPMAVAEFELLNSNNNNNNNNNNVTITANNISQDHYRILPSGQLLIQNVRQQDSNNKYRCIAHNPFLQEKMYANDAVQLKVQKPKHSTTDLKQLRFTLQPKSQITAIIGSNITIECVAHGYPIPKITWTKINGGELPKSRTFISNGIMIITTVQKDDEGVYSCTASNSKSTIEVNTELKIYEMPEIIQNNDNYEWIELQQGQNYDLHCHARGQPKPLISWLHNGYFIDSQITNDFIFDEQQDGSSILRIQSAQPQLHQGIYQCFATNELGTTYAIKVIQFKSVYQNQKNYHQQQNNRFIDNGQVDNNQDDDDDDRIHHKNHLMNKKKHGKHHNNNGKNNQELKLIPPSRPEISKLNDDSVMVRWHVPKTGTGLPIQFFKVQYKELGKGDWNTVDVDIPPHIYSYPVCCLNTNSTYRFRIAAVYTNDDNKNGKSSNKFIFQKDSRMKRPTNSPTILNATSITPEEIVVQWEYLNIDQQPVDGFFINYRSTDSAGQYLMITALGGDCRQQSIPHLQSNTAYEIKMQCFNEAGTSDFSNIYTVKTMAVAKINSKDVDVNLDLNNDINDDDINDFNDNNNNSNNNDDDHNNNQIDIDDQQKSINNNFDINHSNNNDNDGDDGYIFGLIIKPKWLLTKDQYWLALIILIITIILFILSCSIICCLRQQKSTIHSSTNSSSSSATVNDDGTTKLKLENSTTNHHHYFNAINGLIQHQQQQQQQHEQQRRLSSSSSSLSSSAMKTSVLTNGHHHPPPPASGLMMMMLKSNGVAGSQHNINNNNNNNRNHSTTDGELINNDVSCSSSKQSSIMMMMMNRRNSIRNSTHHLFNNNNNEPNPTEPHQQQQINQTTTATIDRKRPLKNSIPGSYLEPSSISQSIAPPSPSINNSNSMNNGGFIQRMNHHHSFTRLNGTLERKRRSRHDLSSTAILNNGHSRTNISNANNNGSTIDMFNNNNHQQYSNSNSGYFHHNGRNNGGNFVIMQSSC